MSALPKIEHPVFETELPSDGRKIKYRSFTGREEKILLTAKESEDIDQVMLSTKQVINNCLIEADINELPLFDIEYLLLCIRARSINNIVEFYIKDPETEEQVRLELNLDDVSLVKNENHDKMIPVDDNTYLEMRYPSWDEFSTYISDMSKNDSSSFVKVMFDCIKNVYHNDEIIPMESVGADEREQFINDLSSGSIVKIKEFFETIPVLRHEIKYTNSKGNEKTFVLEGMKTFFI